MLGGGFARGEGGGGYISSQDMVVVIVCICVCGGEGGDDFQSRFS